MYRAGLGYVVYVFGYEIGSRRTHYRDCALPQSRAASVELVSCALSASQASLASAPVHRFPPGRWRGVGKAGARCAEALRIPRPPYPGEFANPYFPLVQLEVKVQLVTWIRIITVCSNWITSCTALPAMASSGGKSGRQQKEAEDYLSKIKLREIFQVAHMHCIHTKYPILLIECSCVCACVSVFA